MRFDGLRYVFTNNAFGCRAPWSWPVATPLAPIVESSVDGQLYLARTVVTIGTRRLALWVVHTTAPIDPGVGQWNDELDGVVRMLRTDRPRPLLLLGDFNATWGNRGFRAILSTGLTDAAAARGRDLDMTWSQSMAPLPPMVRIDHVLTGPGVEVTAIHTEPGPGSDHRALAATVAVLGIQGPPRAEPRRRCGRAHPRAGVDYDVSMRFTLPTEWFLGRGEGFRSRLAGAPTPPPARRAQNGDARWDA